MGKKMISREEKVKLHENCVKERTGLHAAVKEFHHLLRQGKMTEAFDFMKPWQETEKHAFQYAIFPDEKRCRFLKTISVAGSSAIPDHQRVLSYLSQDARIRFVREKRCIFPAIRIENSFCLPDKLGYVPWRDARRWAAAMDAGATFAGWIHSVDRSTGKISVDVYEHIHFPLDNVSSILFQEGGFGAPHLALKIFFRERTVLYQKQIQPWSRIVQQLMLSFTPMQWEKFALPVLERCNFLGWQNEYIADCVDGMQWKMQIDQEHDNVRQIYGSNDVPEEWDIFQQFISDCLILRFPAKQRFFSVINRDAPGAERTLLDLPQNLDD